MKSNPTTRAFSRTLCFPSSLLDTSAFRAVLAVETKRFYLAKGRSMATKKDRGRVEIVSKPIPPKPAKPGKVKVYRALYTFEPRTPDELFFEEGDILYVSDTNDPNWWKGTCKGRTGLVPSNYVAEQAQSIDAPLQEAAKRGNVSWLRECLDNGVSINGLDKAGNTALYWAAHGGHLDIVEILLSFPNVELNHQNKLGDTSLHAAAWKGHPDIVQSLLEKGVRVDLRNNEKKYAADMATDAQSAALIKRRSGASHINNQDDEYLDEEDSD